MRDCALFDIDGVLVDIRKSYNTAIKKTVEFMLARLSGRPLRGLVTDRIILAFRKSGGFNNDTDTTYAITLALLCNPPKSIEAGRRFLLEAAGMADSTGIAAVEKYLSRFGIERWKSVLAYPGSIADCMLARVFDEFFYGPKLFEKQNKLKPKYWKGRPLISNDVLVVSTRTMRALSEMFGGNLGIVSGRSRVAAAFSLGSVLDFFNPNGCVFLEDEKREYAKPNPHAIKKAMEGMGAKTAVYAGDSAEDLMMAKRAEHETEAQIDFVGVFGFSPIPSETLRTFKELGVRSTARTVNMLPAMIKKGL